MTASPLTRAVKQLGNCQKCLSLIHPLNPFDLWDVRAHVFMDTGGVLIVVSL